MCKEKGPYLGLTGVKNLAELHILPLETGWRQWAASRLTDRSWALSSHLHVTQSLWHSTRNQKRRESSLLIIKILPLCFWFRFPFSKSSCVDFIHLNSSTEAVVISGRRPINLISNHVWKFSDSQDWVFDDNHSEEHSASQISHDTRMKVMVSPHFIWY